VGILSWTAYSIILTQSYLMAETPAGIVSCSVTDDINLSNAITKQMQVGLSLIATRSNRTATEYLRTFSDKSLCAHRRW
jgi:hypothetical protein